MPSPPTGPSPRLNLVARCLAAHAVHRRDHQALVFLHGPDPAHAERRTYGELWEQTLAVAAGLRARGLVPGQRVLLRLPHGSDYVLALLGAVAAGLVAVPVSPQLTAPEVDFLLRDAEAAAVVRGGGLPLAPPPDGCAVVDADTLRAPSARPGPSPLASTRAEQPAFLVYTSGTTGRPKGVLHAHRSLLGRLPMRPGWSDLRPDDRLLHAGQLGWTYTLGVGLFDPWLAGATALLYAGPKDPAVWPALAARHGVTVFAAVPGLLRRILKYGDPRRHDRSRLRHCLTAGEALPPELEAAWRAATGRPLYEAFGMSECSTFVSCGPRTPVRPGSPGRPQPGRRVAALPVDRGTSPLPPFEQGLLAVHRSDPGLMLGYWRRPAEQRAAWRGDWFVSADLVHFDADGYLWHAGRHDEVMNAFGYRVSPREVEEALRAHPGVADVAVAEVEVRSGVSVVTAFVVPDGPRPPGRSDLLRWAAGRLAPYKRPRELRFVSELPRNRAGKLVRRALTGLLA